MADWRYISQNILTGEFTCWDLPLKITSGPSWELSGPGSMQATISPENFQGIELEEWQTAIYAEESGEIRWGGILRNVTASGAELMLDCAGFSSYPNGVPYVGPNVSGVNLDPSQIFLDLWAHIQTQPDGNLGVVVRRPTPVAVRVGTKDEPYVLNNAEYPDCGDEMSSLASETPFDFVESHQWLDTESPIIEHTITLGYPRIGRRRNDLSFSDDQNIISLIPVSRDGEIFSNIVYGIGKGEGDKMIRAEVAQRDGRLRRPTVYTNKLADTKDRLTSECRRQQVMRMLEPDISSITVRNHDSAPIGSWQCGDDILIRAELPFVGFVEVWSRIISWTMAGDNTATLGLVRSDRYYYAARETVEPAPVTPEVVGPVTAMLATFNTRRDSADVKGHDWDTDNRKTHAIAAINSFAPSLMGSQECTPNQSKDIVAGCGLSQINTGNVVLFYRPSDWVASNVKKYVLDASSDDRRLLAATFTHRVTGRVLRVGCTHLTNVDGGPGKSDDGWRIKQMRQALEYEPKLQVFFGDFNSPTDVYKVAKEVAGLEQSRNKTTGVQTNPTLNSSNQYKPSGTTSRRIDEVLTRTDVVVINSGVINLDGSSPYPFASDHNIVYAEIGV